MDNPKTIQYALRLLHVLPDIENPSPLLIKRLKGQTTVARLMDAPDFTVLISIWSIAFMLHRSFMLLANSSFSFSFFFSLLLFLVLW
jgi:hypothetical protein